MAQKFDNEIDKVISELYAIIDESRRIQIRMLRLKSVIANNAPLVNAITDENLQGRTDGVFSHLTRNLLIEAFNAVEKAENGNRTGILPAIEAAMDEFDKVKVS